MARFDQLFLELQSFFYVSDAIVDIYDLAGKVVEFLIEACETHVHIRAQASHFRAEISDAGVLEVEPHQKND